MAWLLDVVGIVRKSVFLCSAFVILLVTEASAQSCQLPSKLSQLSDILITYPDDNGPISVRRAVQLSDMLDGMDDQDLVVQLRENGLQSLSMTVADLMSVAERIAGAAEIRDARRLKSLLRDLNQQALIACADSGNEIFQNIQQEREGGLLSAGKVDWQAVNRLLAKDRALSLGVLVVLIAIVIGVLYLVDSTYRLAMAMLYNRKACRIPVTLRLGTDRLSVVVTTLGRGGCRIVPDEPVMFDTYLAKLRQTSNVFDFDGTLIEAQVSAIYEDVSDFRFLYPIPLRMQKALLEQSTISPFYIKKNRRKPPPKAEASS